MSGKNEREMRWGSRLENRVKKASQPAFFQCGLVVVTVGIPSATFEDAGRNKVAGADRNTEKTA